MEVEIQENNGKVTDNKDPSTEPYSADSSNSEDENNKEEALESSFRDKLLALEKDNSKLKDQNLRLAAEMENLRRRQSRESEELKKFANEKILETLLPVLDSLDKALDAVDVGPSDAKEDSEESFITGFKMVKKQLIDCLERHGLERIRAEEAVFDPNLHQAIQRQESESVEEDMVAEVFAAGYMLNGRLLRPAMVSVRVPKSDGDK